MPSLRSTAIILRAYNFSEADRVLVLFTRQYGKLRAVAKGVRRNQSRMAGCLGLMSLSELQCHGKEHQELMLITQGQLLQAYPRIKADLILLGQAARMCELVEQMTPDRQPLPEIFSLLTEGLELLEESEQASLAGIWFAVSFLDKMGYRPGLGACMQCGQPSASMSFVPTQGGVVCSQCGGGALTLSPGARKWLEKLMQSDSRHVRRMRLLGPMAREMDAVINAALQHQLGHPLRSDKFRAAMGNLKAMGQPATAPKEPR